MTQETPSRREWLRRVTVTTAVIGSAPGTVAGVAVGDDRKTGETSAGDRDGCDNEGVRLTPACVDEKRDAAIFCVTNDGTDDVTLEWRSVTPPEERIEFVDCRTVRVVGDFVDVILEATFVAADGEIGNVIEPVGAVDGERTFDARELERIPDDAVVGTAEAFRDDPAVPGAGDLTASNPEFDACQEEFFGEIILGGGSDAADAGDCDRETNEKRDDAGPADDPEPDDPLETLTVPAGMTTCFSVEAPDGEIAVRLFREGELLAERTSAVETSCPFPVPVGVDPVTLPTNLLETYL
ncbi:hypothetical protein [Natronococcus wangiae]|uniref:hypothetical protein n=1 Tax=Natronococcus wangiae TaxID=3068275 RepID=UPI0027402D76|nr:hypothetical protein [Natronococcus sp. AD5]